MTTIRASCSPGEIRVAVLDGDTLTAYGLWRPGAPDGLGDVHAARITARVPAMAGAFADIGTASGFLPDGEGGRHPEGMLLTVRVTRTAQGDKGPRLAALPDAPEPGPPRLLRRGPHALSRIAAACPDATILLDDAAVFAQLRPDYGKRLSLVPRAFDDTLEADIEELGTSSAALPGGLRATFTPTPALIAIDLDGGSSTASRSEKSAGQLAANRAALPALARQIALRNLSGAIVIDLAGIPVRRRAALAPDLADALAADPARPRLLGFSNLGLAEIVRPRGAAPLHELLATPHAAGLAALRQAAVEPSTRRLRLRASPALLAALQTDPAGLPDLARRLTHPLILVADPGLPPAGWVIEDAA